MTAVHRGTRVLVVAAMLVGLVASALGFAGAAAAHAARIASDPAENAQLTQQPARVNATFNETMQSQFAAMTVIGPDGAQWSDGDVAVDGAVIGVAVRAGGPGGTYTVNYRATSADGHVVTGSWSYELAAVGASTATATSAAPATTTAAPAAEGASDGPPVWPFVVVIAAIVAAGAVWAVRRRA